MQKGEVFTVSGLTLVIKTVIEDTLVLQGIWVRGEISDFTLQSSGHMYFTLKDAGARLRCVMFRRQNTGLKFRPAEGLEVLAYGSVSIYERRGEYQFYVEELEPAGLGSLYLAFNQLKERLAREGLFEPARKQTLPAFPCRIALITSPTGAAVHDMIRILHERQPWLDLLVVPVLVQGLEAAKSIATGLEVASNLDEIDLIIVGRGGGSPEELQPFNEEIVARAIAACRHPVISAVGHEIDVTISDLVADARAPTPTAAAEMAVRDGRLLHRSVIDLAYRLTRAIHGKVTFGRDRLSRICARYCLARPERMLAGRKQALDETRQALARAARIRLAGTRERLSTAIARLDTLSPLATLGRGYAICLDSAGHVLRQADPVSIGDDVQVRLARGRLFCSVKKKEDCRGSDA